MKRQRGRNRNNNNNNRSHNNSNRSLDSAGPDVKVRGSASTIYEKYSTLARDAASSGNRVKAENYRQHAEHYLRLVNAQEAVKQAAREEAEAAKAARGDSDSDNNDGEGRRNRRYPPRVKRSRDNDASDGSAKKQSDDNAPADGLEVVTPKGENGPSESVAKDAKAKVQSESEPKSEPEAKRRRKAPSRKKSDDAQAEKSAEVDAAE